MTHKNSENVEKILYFAYGSNLDPKQIGKRCPGYAFHAKALLPGHRLCFPRKSKGRGCGVASVEACHGAEVWGVVYSLTASDKKAMDRAEGVRSGAYFISDRTVFIDGDQTRPLEVLTYIANPQDDPPPPNKAYLNHLIDGAKHWELPPEYIRKLKSIRTMEA